MDTPKISIIVPVYNAAKTIRRGIDSVLNQNYRCWELILVNDGSIDCSDTICDKYALSDPRIKAYHCVNKGASVARNIGLENATGEWITFLDSDDWFEPHHLETFYKQIKAGVDLGVNSFIVDLKYGSRNIHLCECFTISNAESINCFFDKLQLHSQFIWNKIFKNALLSKYRIRFNTGVSLGEDNIFLLEYLKYVESLSSVGVSTYHYDQVDENPNSLGRRWRDRIELETQINTNCNAMLSLYNHCNESLILNRASNYYFTRVFERIIAKNGHINITDQIEYIKLYPMLDIQYISDPTISRYWNCVKSRSNIARVFVLTSYKSKLWSKSKIITAVAVVKRVCKYVLRRA